jgi:hypothetical protein
MRLKLLSRAVNAARMAAFNGSLTATLFSPDGTAKSSGATDERQL